MVDDRMAREKRKKQAIRKIGELIREEKVTGINLPKVSTEGLQAIQAAGKGRISHEAGVVLKSREGVYYGTAPGTKRRKKGR